MSNPVAFTHQQKLAIAELYASKEASESFDLWGCEAAESIRRSAKAHGIKSQLRRCCYCKEQVNSTNFKMWEVEHVLPQSDFHNFTFEPENLAVACPDCNTIKLNKPVSKRKTYKRFPKSSASYLIVHPHFDVYNDHIWKSGLIFQPKSPKGRKTIEICGLLRLAEKYVDWQNVEDVSKIEEEINIMTNGKADPVKVKSLMAQLINLL